MPDRIDIYETADEGQMMVDRELFPYTLSKPGPVVVKKHGYYEVTVTLFANEVDYSVVPLRVNADGSVVVPEDVFGGQP